MKTIIIFCLAIITANCVLADIYSTATRQAKSAAEQTPSSAPQPTQPQQIPSAAQPDPVLEATLHNIANLRADFDAFGRLAETNSGETEKMSLLNDLNAAPQGTKPSQISVNKLAMNLANAVAGRDNMREQHTKLAQDVHAIFNCSHLSVEQEQDIFDDVQRILLTGGTTPDVVTNVVISVKAIAAETK